MADIFAVLEALGIATSGTAEALIGERDRKRDRELEAAREERAQKSFETNQLLANLGIQKELVGQAAQGLNPEDLEGAPILRGGGGAPTAIPMDPNAGPNAVPSETIPLEQGVGEPKLPPEVEQLISQSPTGREKTLAALRTTVTGRAREEERQTDLQVERAAATARAVARANMEAKWAPFVEPDSPEADDLIRAGIELEGRIRDLEVENLEVMVDARRAEMEKFNEIWNGLTPDRQTALATRMRGELVRSASGIRSMRIRDIIDPKTGEPAATPERAQKLLESDEVQVGISMRESYERAAAQLIQQYEEKGEFHMRPFILQELNKVLIGSEIAGIDTEAPEEEQTLDADFLIGQPLLEIFNQLDERFGLTRALGKDGARAGTRPQEPQGASSNRAPTDSLVPGGRVTSSFQRHIDTGRNQGVDIAAPAGTPILTPTSGTVKRVGFQKGLAGHFVIVEDSQGREHKFFHMSQAPTLKAGQRVESGDPIGLVGSTGRSSGNHLHYEVRRGKTFLDPIELLEGL